MLMLWVMLFDDSVRYAAMSVHDKFLFADGV